MITLKQILQSQPQLSTTCLRQYAASTRKTKASVLLQDPDRVPVLKANTSAPSDRRVYVWGLSETGALGMHKSLKKQSQKQAAFIQHPSRLQFAEQHKVLDIAAGYGFTAFAVQHDEQSEEQQLTAAKCEDDSENSRGRRRPTVSSLYGCGINTDSQLGYQHLDMHPDRPLELLIYPAPIQLPVAGPIQIDRCVAGRAHLLALDTRAGRVYALGNNAYGQCGRPIIADESYAASGTVHVLDGGAVGGERIVDVHCGQDHSLLLTAGGRVFACGWGADGQTGLGHYGSQAEPTQVRGDIDGERIVKVAGSVDCVLALNDRGEVFGWGNSEYGQLVVDGDEQQINRPQALKTLKGAGKTVDIAAGGSSCIVLNENGDVFVWGYGLLGFGPAVDHQPVPTQIPATLFGRNEFNPQSRVRSVHSGISHMVAVNEEQDAYVWGRNKFGCLGLGHQKDQFFPLKIAVGAKVHKIACGVDHTVAMCKAFV